MILALTATDAATVTALWHTCGLTRPWNDPDVDFRRAIDAESATVLGYLDGDRVVGTAMVGHDGHRGWVYYLAVAASHRGQGLGRELMRAAERWLSEREVPKIQFMVRADNSEVMAFYEHLGYTDQLVSVLGRRLDGV